MVRRKKGLLAAAMAFAATPQGRALLMQAKEYATRPETKQKAQQLIAQARSKRKGGTPSNRFSEPVRDATPIRDTTTPPYGTPPKH